MDDRRCEGFTLAELLVVLAVAALVLGQALPAGLRLIDNARLHGAARALQEALLTTRSLATEHNHPVWFVLDTRDGGWCFGWTENPACDCRSESACRRGRARDWPGIRAMTAAQAGARLRIRFSPVRGLATAASFSLANRYRRVRIRISPLGRIRVCSDSAPGYPPCA